MDIESIKGDTKERMEKTLTTLDKEFAKLRTGRATTDLVDGIKVESYGSLMPINQLATVSVPDSRTLTIQPWDKSSFAPIEKAILKADLGLSAVNDGKLLRIVIPPLTEDRRKELVKVARKYTEEAKVAIRNIRREANDHLKKLEKDKAATEDEHRKANDEVQKLTDNYAHKADERCSLKEKDVMQL